MQNDNCKNQNNHLPLPGRGEKLTFQSIISDFYFQASVNEHCTCLNELCLAFTGDTRSINASKLDLSNMVFQVNSLKKFIINMNNLFNDADFDQSVAGIVGNVLSDINVMNCIEVLDDALMSWIDIENWTSWKLDYLRAALECFTTIDDLIKVCGKVDLIFANQLKGGVSCEN